MQNINWFKVSKFFLYVSALYVAIVVSTSLFPFIVGKYVWFRVSVDLTLIAFLIGYAVRPEAVHYIARLKNMLREPLVIAVLVFAVIFILACFFGVDPAQSFWSNFERGEGGIQVLHLALFFLLLSTLFEKREEWERMFIWVLVGGVLMAAYGFFAGVEMGGFIGPAFSTPGFRLQGSIGNPAYVAAFSLFCLLFSVYLINSRHVRGKKLLSFGTGILVLLGLVFLTTFYVAATRGALIGLVIAALVFAGYFAFSHRAWRKRVIAAGVILLALVVTAVVFKDAPIIKSLPGSRIFDISFTTQTFQDRSVMWKIAYDGFKERPLLGWGPENYIKVFDHDFNITYFKPGQAFGAWFDRAHSVVFDYLVETGALGLLAYLGIFVVFYWQFFAMRRRNGSSGSPFGDAVLFALPVAYLVQGIVLFDVLTIYYNWFLFLALSLVAIKLKFTEGGAHAAAPETRGAQRVGSVSARYSIAAGGGVIALLLIVYGSYLPIAKSRRYINVIRQLPSIHSLTDFKKLYDTAFLYSSPVGSEEVAKFAAYDVLNIISQPGQPEDVFRGLVEYIEPYMNKDNVRHLLALAQMYQTLWQEYGKKDEYFAKAEGYYRDAEVIGPKLPPVLYSLANLYLEKGDITKANGVASRILELWPDAARDFAQQPAALEVTSTTPTPAN